MKALCNSVIHSVYLAFIEDEQHFLMFCDGYNLLCDKSYLLVFHLRMSIGWVKFCDLNM